MEHTSKMTSGEAASAPNAGALGPGGEAALEASLAQAIRGFELVDQALELGRGQHAHLLGVDAEGSLVLVLLVAGDAETAPLRALDALRYGTRHGEAIVRHLNHARLLPDAGLRVALVAEAFDETALERLRPLEGAGVEAYALRTIRSRGQESSYLEPVVGGGRASFSAVPKASSVEELLGSLGSRQREVAGEVRARLERLDERLALSAESGSMVWRREGEELAVLEFEGEHLSRGSAPGRSPGRSPRTLDSERELELFVDDVVAEYLRRADPGFGSGG